jgi:hypothetical protein
MSSKPYRSRGPLSLAIALALVAGSAHAATITVIDGGDSGGTSATCMLRQAITTITAKATTGTGCSNSGDDFGSNDTIVFGNTLTGATITLSLGQLSVSGLTTPLTIQGSGQTIDANKLSRVLYAKSVTLAVSGLTLTGGSADLGGGVYATDSTVTLSYSAVSGNSASLRGGGVDANNGSTVTLTNSTVSGNSSTTGDGGGVAALTSSTVKLTNSTISGNSAFASGGGVNAVDGTVTLTDSTLSGNSAFAGGGVYTFNYGTVRLTNSTVSGNSAGNWGGGVVAYFTLTLTNSTVTGNSAEAGAGVMASQCNMTVTDSTVTGNSATSVAGGVWVRSTSTLTLANSILSGNTSPLGPDIYSTSSLSATYSLLGTALMPANSGNQNIFFDNPGVSALANNGGPTQTMALNPTSPAVNAGSNALVPGGIQYDQRGVGYARIVNGSADIGAFELSDTIFTSGFDSGP